MKALHPHEWAVLGQLASFHTSVATDSLHPLRFRGLIHLPGLFMPRSLAVVDAPIVRVGVVAAKQLTQRVAGEAQQRLLLLALQVGEVCRRIALGVDSRQVSVTKLHLPLGLLAKALHGHLGVAPSSCPDVAHGAAVGCCSVSPPSRAIIPRVFEAFSRGERPQNGVRGLRVGAGRRDHSSVGIVGFDHLETALGQSLALRTASVAQ